MSLILDALKKSEAERRRGQPPTLHMQFGGGSRRARRAPWVTGAGAVLLAAGLAGGWMWLGAARSDSAGPDAGGVTPLAASPEAPAGEAPVVVSETVASAAAPPASVLEAGPGPEFRTTSVEAALGAVDGAGSGASVSGGGMPVPERAMLYTPGVDPAPSSASAGVQAPASAPPPSPISPPSAIPDSSVSVQSPAPQMADPPDPVEPAVAYAPMPAPEAADPAKEPEADLPFIHALPYATRKDLPKLDLSMHVFSPERNERFIVLNGKRYTLESPAPGPELALLDIVADGAVFEFRGQRFLLPRQTF